MLFAMSQTRRSVRRSCEQRLATKRQLQEIETMSTKAKNATRTTKTKVDKKVPASLVWFEIPADDIRRAKTFYRGLFGWKINPFPAMQDYQHIDTGGADASPDGGLMKRMHPEHTITAYIMVPSVDKAAAKVEKLGGSICRPKTAVPGMGYFAICQDTEKNAFAVWERDEDAK
jgi:predicted enzyme related to lactoylglutathione lyase